jgi:hypothetical protein
MSRRGQLAFLLLVGLQAAHSVEEYAAGLYEVLAPARFLSSLVSDDPRVGFAIINGALVAFGFWCYLVPIRSGRSSARAWAWPWVFIELANGVGHVGLALLASGYFPGALTAPFLLVSAAWLAFLLKKDPPSAADLRRAPAVSR